MLDFGTGWPRYATNLTGAWLGGGMAGVTITDGGTFIPGPYTLHTRSEILDRIRACCRIQARAILYQDVVARLVSELLYVDACR